MTAASRKPPPPYGLISQSKPRQTESPVGGGRDDTPAHPQTLQLSRSGSPSAVSQLDVLSENAIHQIPSSCWQFSSDNHAQKLVVAMTPGLWAGPLNYSTRHYCWKLRSDEVPEHASRHSQ